MSSTNKTAFSDIFQKAKHGEVTSISLRLPVTLKEKITKIAKQEGTSTTNAINKILAYFADTYFNNQEGK